MPNAPDLVPPPAHPELRSDVGPEPRTRDLERSKPRASIVVGSLWMVFLSLILFFLPAINGLIAGLVGGYKVGSIKRGLIAAILPSVVVGAGLWILFVVLDVPVLGLVAGFAIAALIVLSDLGLFLGAALGGMVGRRAELPGARVV